MHEIDVSKLDLNLLNALHALLQEASVTRAARRLGIGQPAASHALGRLRDLFADPLLVRSGRAMVLTPRAQGLAEPLSRLLSDAARLVEHRPAFDPQSTTRRFIVVCPDLLAAVLPGIIARLQSDAPRARLEVLNRTPNAARDLEDGLADLLVGPAVEETSGLFQRGLGDVHFGVFARRGHPGVLRSGKLRANAWVRFPHVVVRSGSQSRSVVGAALDSAGLERDVTLVVPSFLAALLAVSRSDLFFAGPTELLRPWREQFGVVHARAPLSIAPVRVAAMWHERWHADPAHRFFRGLVADEVSAHIRRPTG